MIVTTTRCSVRQVTMLSWITGKMLLSYGGTKKHSFHTSKSLTKQKDSSNRIVPVLMFLGVIAATLAVIVAGYFHGNMHLLTTLKNAASS